jgi:hypothetical protein
LVVGSRKRVHYPALRTPPSPLKPNSTPSTTTAHAHLFPRKLGPNTNAVILFLWTACGNARLFKPPSPFHHSPVCLQEQINLAPPPSYCAALRRTKTKTARDDGSHVSILLHRAKTQRGVRSVTHALAISICRVCTTFAATSASRDCTKKAMQQLFSFL